MRILLVATSLVALAAACALPEGGLGSPGDTPTGSAAEASAPASQEGGTAVEASAEAGSPGPEAGGPTSEAGSVEAGDDSASQPDPGDDGDDGGDSDQAKGKSK